MKDLLGPAQIVAKTVFYIKNLFIFSTIYLNYRETISGLAAFIILFVLSILFSKSFLFPQHHAPTLAELVVLGHEFVLEVRGFDVGEAVELVVIAFAVRWAAGAALPFQLGQVDGEAESEAVCRSR